MDGPPGDRENDCLAARTGDKPLNVAAAAADVILDDFDRATKVRGNLLQIPAVRHRLVDLPFAGRVGGHLAEKAFGHWSLRSRIADQDDRDRHRTNGEQQQQPSSSRLHSHATKLPRPEATSYLQDVGPSFTGLACSISSRRSSPPGVFYPTTPMIDHVALRKPHPPVGRIVEGTGH